MSAFALAASTMSAFAEAAANDAAFCVVGAHVTMFADGIGEIADTAIVSIVIIAIGAKGEIPGAGAAWVVRAGVGCGGIAPDVDLVATRPLLVGVTMAGGQGGGEEYELDMTGLFHGRVISG